jgi:3-dehydroquinate dehydratase type I
VDEITKTLSPPRIIGIINAANRKDERIWEALAQCDMAELRADGVEPAAIPAWAAGFREESLKRLGRALETIFTLRLEKDGGLWRNALAQEREKVWSALDLETGNAPCEWLDLETEEFSRLPPVLRSAWEAGTVKLLSSHHNCRQSYSPEGLRVLLRDMRAQAPDGMKVAVTCGTRAELTELLGFAREMQAATLNGCVLSMGVLGRATRVAAPLLGCPFTYGYLTDGPAAPGQLSVFQLRAFFQIAADEDFLSLSDQLVLDRVESRLPKAALAL